MITSRDNSHTTQGKANLKEQLAHSLGIHAFPGGASNESQFAETNSLYSTVDYLQIPIQP